MKKKYIFLLVLLSFIFIPQVVSAKQLRKISEWNTNVLSFDVEKDNNNNYYVTGNAFFDDYVLKKYDSNHNLLLSKKISDTELCKSVSLDSNNNIYLLCQKFTFFKDPTNNITREWSSNTLSHYHIIKLSNTGDILFDKDLEDSNNYGYYSGFKIYNNYLYIVGSTYILQNYIRTENTYNYYNYLAKKTLIKMNLSGTIVNKVYLGNVNKSVEVRYLNDTANIGAGGGGSIQVKDNTFIINNNKIYVYYSLNKELFLGVYNTSNLEEISKTEIGTNSSITDITPTSDGNLVVVGNIDVKDLNSSQTSLRRPMIMNYSPNISLLSNKIINGNGNFIALINKDNGYYGVVQLSEKNISEYDNDSTGYYLVRYDNNFNVESKVKLSSYAINLFDFNEKGISVLNNWDSIQYYSFEDDYSVNIVDSIDKGTLNLEEDRKYFSNEIVSFNVTLNEGYIVKDIIVKDSNENNIAVNDNSFIMPNSDVTITPIYEKVKSSINVEIVNETEDLTVEINDMTQVEYEEEVKFKVKPIKGYKVKSIRIIDENNNEVNFSETDKNNEYIFTMPAVDVTIIPVYEKITSSVSYEMNDHAKEITIEVNDVMAVVYEDKVKFTIDVEDGYEIDTIEIEDQEGNILDYKKTNNKNEYEFVMPYTDVIIKPTFRRVESNTKLKNPKTGSNILVLLVIMSLSIGIFIYKKKKNLVDSRSRTKFKI